MYKFTRGERLTHSIWGDGIFVKYDCDEGNVYIDFDVKTTIGHVACVSIKNCKLIDYKKRVREV